MFDRLARNILLLAVTTSPFLAFSFFSLSRESVRDFAAMILVIVALLLWSLGRLVLRTCRITAHWLWIGCALVLIVFFVSTLWSTVPARAFGGEMGEWGTVFSLVIFMVVLVLSALLLSEAIHRRRALLVVVLVSALLWFLEIILTVFRLVQILPNWIPPVGFSSGSPSDLAYLGGVAVIISLILLEQYRASLSRRLKILLSVALGLLLVGEVILDQWSVWLALGIVGFLIFVEPYLRSPLLGASRRILRPAFLVLIISIPFLVWGGGAGLLGAPLDRLSNFLGWSTVEVRPSWGATWQIARRSLADHPWLGSGPNHFAIDWQRYRPAQPVNATTFAEMDFPTGAGTISTLAFGGGWVGLLAWVVLIGSLLLALIRSGWQNLRVRKAKRITASGAAEWWLMALPLVYLWLFAIVVRVNFSFLLLTAFLTGLFLAWLGAVKLAPVWGDNRRRGKKVVGVAATIALILSLIGGAWLTGRLIAGAHLASGTKAFYVERNLATALPALAASAARAPLPRAYRMMAEVNLAALQDLLAEPGQTAETVRFRFQELASSAVSNARLATERDPEDYRNFLTLGAVYRALLPLGFPEANNLAEKAYQTASALAPHLPTIYLERARLALVRKDSVAAGQWLTSALAEKPDSSQLWYELGWLRYQEGENDEAITALSRALAIDPYFSNARYFLALSYKQSGNLEAALAEFERVLLANPDRTDLREMVGRLRDSLPRSNG